MLSNQSLILVTPAKNEEKNVKGLVEVMAKLKFKPNVWIFVNDSSSDNTVSRFREAVSEQELENVIDIIIVTHEDENNPEYALGSKYSKVVLFGLNNVYEYERVKGNEFDFVGVLDCDIVPEEEYYSKLLNQMTKDPSIGIASGGTQYEYDPNSQLVTTTVNYKNHAPGGLRVWRRECLKDTGYFPSTSQDAVSAARAIMKGWKVLSYKNITVSMRERGANFGYDYYGESAYKRHVPYWYLLLKVIKLSLTTEFRKSYLYHKGYLSARRRKEERITDELAIEYFKTQPYKRLLGVFKRQS